MKALSVHGGGAELERISDSVGGLVELPPVDDAVDSKATLVGLDVDDMLEAMSQSSSTDDG